MSYHYLLIALLLVAPAATACTNKAKKAEEPVRLTREEDWTVETFEISESGVWIEGDERIQLPFWAVGGVIRVDDKLIPKRVFNEVARQQAHRNIARHLHRSYAQIVLDRIVSGYLLDKAAEDAGVVIEEEAVDTEVEKSLSKLETQEDIDAYFDSVGLDAKSYRDLIRRQLYHKQFLTEVYEVRVTEQEAQDHYKRYKRRYDKKAEVKASHILFKFSSSRPSPEEVEKKRKEAASVAQMARQPGANFAELARQYSEGPSGPKGGDLGYFQANRMVRPFSDKAFSMQVGEVSEPVKTRFGWHVIRVEDRKPARLIPFEEVREELEMELLQKKLVQAQNVFLRRAKSEHDIEYLTRNIRYHEKKAPSTQPRRYPESQPRYP
jgi:parvulin-like peptidyl-prolyl isomerase